MEPHPTVAGRRWRHYGSRTAVYVLLLLITVVMLYPFYYMGFNSFRSLDQYYAGHGFSFASWRGLFHTLPIGRQLLNSTIITLSAIAIILAVSTTGGYAFAVLGYRASKLVFLVIVAAMMVRFISRPLTQP